MTFIKKHRYIYLLLILLVIICCVIVGTNFVYNLVTAHGLDNRESKFALKRRSYMYVQASPAMHDLGGMKTINGHYKIRRDMIFRGGAWTKPTQRSIRVMNRLHIHQIIDLRSVHEPVTGIDTTPQINELGKNPAAYHIHYYNYPVNTAHQRIISYKKRHIIGEHYRFRYWYSNNPIARRAYHYTIIRLIKDGKTKTPVLITCTQGRDRTGVASALIEHILGVSKRDVLYDFLLTDEYIPQTSLPNQAMRMNVFYKHVNKRYGSLNNYIHKGLHISNHDIHVLKREFLVRTK